jgi:hypothetical protein
MLKKLQLMSIQKIQFNRLIDKLHTYAGQNAKINRRTRLEICLKLHIQRNKQ